MVVVMIVRTIIMVIMMAVKIMAAMLPTDVMTVNPLLVVMGPMARDPNHFIVARPIAGAMAVIGPVPNLDAEALRRNCGRENDARGRERGEQ
jgi:hypothetical protein